MHLQGCYGNAARADSRPAPTNACRENTNLINRQILTLSQIHNSRTDPLKAGQQLSSAIAVLEIGGQHRHQQQQANRVHQDVTLASVDLLARVVASLVARLRASDALAVDDPRTGLAISSSRHAHLFAQMSVNSHPKPIALPQSEIVIDRSPPGKVLRQIAPLAAGLCEIEDRIDKLPKGMLARPSRLGGPGKAVIDQLPFGISKVGSITHPQGNRGMYIQWRLFQNLVL